MRLGRGGPLVVRIQPIYRRRRAVHPRLLLALSLTFSFSFIPPPYLFLFHRPTSLSNRNSPIHPGSISFNDLLLFYDLTGKILIRAPFVPKKLYMHLHTSVWNVAFLPCLWHCLILFYYKIRKLLFIVFFFRICVQYHCKLIHLYPIYSSYTYGRVASDQS